MTDTDFQDMRPTWQAYMKPEKRARKKIDDLLIAAGLTVQNMNELNLGASLSVAVLEYPLSTEDKKRRK